MYMEINESEDEITVYSKSFHIAMRLLILKSGFRQVKALFNVSLQSLFNQTDSNDSLSVIHDVGPWVAFVFLVEKFTNVQNGLATTPVSGLVIPVDEYAIKSNRK